MTGVFTLLAYLFIAFIVSCVFLIIFKINYVKGIILNRTIKNIFIITTLIIVIPIVIGVLMVFR